MKRSKKEQLQIGSAEKENPAPIVQSQNGSAIVLVLMVLATMTIIGIVSANTLITENFIVRNVGIQKQNTNILDSAIMQGLQQFMEIRDDDTDNFLASAPAAANNQLWINDVNATPAPPIVADWYEALYSGRCLDAANSNTNDTLPLLTARGENGNLRYAAIGWSPVNLGNSGSSSLVVGTGPVWHGGRILAEYVSDDGGGNDNGFGLKRMEIGVRRKW